MTGRIPGEKLEYRYALEISPRGQLWSDPWGFASNGSGRPPPSAIKCEKLSIAYLDAYNAAILRLGVLRKPIGKTEPPQVPLLRGDERTGRYENLYEGATRATYLSALTLPVRTLAKIPGYLTKSDIDREKDRRRSLIRSIASSKILRFDMNDDGILTRAEFNGLEGRNLNPGDEQIFEKYDLNRDDSITVEEVVTGFVDEHRDTQRALPVIELMLSQDPNHDGRLTVEELEGIGRATFSQIDTDGNDIISWQESDRTVTLLYRKGERERAEARRRFERSD